VVGGNYKLIVMGRVHGPHVNSPHVTQWKSAGGILHDVTSTPGAAETVSVKWSQTDDGTWEVTEQTEKGEVYTNIIGRMEDIFSGLSLIRYTGYGGAEQDPDAAEKPAITERTYARNIASITKVDGAVTESTRIEGNLTETTRTVSALAAIYERTEVSDSEGSITESIGTEEERIGNYTERSFAGMVFSYEQFEKKEETEEGNWTNEISLGLEAQVSVGTKLELHYDQVDVTFGLSAEFETAFALKAEAQLAASLEVTIGEFADVGLEALSHEYSLMHLVDHGVGGVLALGEIVVGGLEFLQTLNSVSS
jgi:hypothetical protein